MKIKKLIAVLLAVLMLASVLAACAKSTADAEMGYAEAPKENANYSNISENIFDSITGDSSQMDDTEIATESIAQTVTDRKLVRRINIDAETEDLDSLICGIDAKVALLGGYIQSRNVYTGSRYSDRTGRRYASLTLRIPKDKLDEFVSHVGNTSNVISSNETSDDVTLTYVATQSRVTALQKEEARLLELIDKAANLTELLELEKRLTQVRTDLENVTSQLLMYDNLVDYGTVSLSISEVEVLTLTQEPSFWSRITNGFMLSLRNLWNFIKELAIFLVVASPYILPLATVVLVVVLTIRRKRRKIKDQPPTKAE